MTTAPFATARLEGHEVVLTIGDEQIRYDNGVNGYQAAHEIARQVCEIQAREVADPIGSFEKRVGIVPEPSLDEAHRLALIEDAERSAEIDPGSVDDEPPTKVEGQRRSTPPGLLALTDEQRAMLNAANNVPIATPTGEKPAA